MSTLHITNGDAVGGTLITAGFGDAVLPWRDVLHDGPVPGRLDAASLRQVRAEFLSGRGAGSFDSIFADLAGRDAQLAAASANDNVVLWFEPDLYDQLQLLQVMSRLYLRPLMERPSISIVAADELLGPLDSRKLAKYADTLRTVREVDLELAASGWEAFTSTDHTALRQFAATETELFAAPGYAADATVILPHLHAAMRRLLEEYPSPTNGLSRTEQQMLDVLRAGPRTVASTYQAAHAPMEAFAWLGDWSFAWYVERLMRARTPLLEFTDDGESAAPTASAAGDGLWQRSVQLTAAGQEVVAGRQHAIALNGMDRWIGGVHLEHAAP